MATFLQLLANGLVAGGGYVLAALGLTLVFGILDVINFAHGIFYTLGAYVALTAAQSAGFAFFPAMLIAMAAVAAVAVIAERIVFRPLRFMGHMPAIIASMGLALVMGDAVRLVWTANPRYLPGPFASRVLNLAGIILSFQRLLILVVALILVAVLYLVIERTQLGLQMRALAQDPIGAKLSGTDVDRISAITFAIAGATAAAAGILISPVFALTPFAGDVVTIKSFAIVVLGGVGSIPGTIIAGLMLGVVESLTSGYVSVGLESLVAFVVLIATLLFKPSGLLGRGG